MNSQLLQPRTVHHFLTPKPAALAFPVKHISCSNEAANPITPHPHRPSPLPLPPSFASLVLIAVSPFPIHPPLFSPRYSPTPVKHNQSIQPSRPTAKFLNITEENPCNDPRYSFQVRDHKSLNMFSPLPCSPATSFPSLRHCVTPFVLPPTSQQGKPPGKKKKKKPLHHSVPFSRVTASSDHKGPHMSRLQSSARGREAQGTWALAVWFFQLLGNFEFFKIQSRNNQG